MKKQITILIASLTIFIVAFGVVGCPSDESENKSNHAIADVLDSVTESISKDIASAVVVSAGNQDIEKTQPTVQDVTPSDNVQGFSDFIVRNGKIYAVGDNSLYVYDIKTKTQQIHAVEGELNTVAYFDGSIYVGGDQLLKLNDTTLEFVDDEFDGTVTELYTYGLQLMVGTSNGLYRRGIFGKDKLMDNITVSAITEDNSGLWIGSKGEGLYRWDGENFQKRFLRRDTSLFDFVNTIDFKHNHLYVGCDNGLYVYDGGKWKTLTTEDGLPDNNVRTIDATNWTVYIGTDKGVVGYFEEQLSPVNTLETKQVNALQVRGVKLLAATEYEGILEKNGNVLKTIIQPIKLENLQILSLIY